MSAIVAVKYSVWQEYIHKSWLYRISLTSPSCYIVTIYIRTEVFLVYLILIVFSLGIPHSSSNDWDFWESSFYRMFNLNSMSALWLQDPNIPAVHILYSVTISPPGVFLCPFSWWSKLRKVCCVYWLSICISLFILWLVNLQHKVVLWEAFWKEHGHKSWLLSI